MQEDSTLLAGNVGDEIGMKRYRPRQAWWPLGVLRLCDLEATKAKQDVNKRMDLEPIFDWPLKKQYLHGIQGQPKETR